MVSTGMYICICKQVSDAHVLEAWEAGHRDVDALRQELGLGANCGSCSNFTREFLQEISTKGVDDFKP